MVEGVPPPMLGWHHKGAPIRPPKTGQSATLSPKTLYEAAFIRVPLCDLLANSGAWQDAELECRAENLAGTDAKKFTIIVMGP